MRSYESFEPYPALDELMRFFEGRYGLKPEVFQDHRFWYRPSSPGIWVAAAELEPPRGLILEAVGLMALRDPPPGGKLTSVFAQRFGASATRNVVEVDGDGAALFLARASQPCDVALKGYCIVRFEGQALGCGLAEGGVLQSQIPKGWLNQGES